MAFCKKYLIKEEYKMEKVLTSENFDAEVYGSDLPVLVDFYADWCSPCRAMAPMVEALAGEYEGRAKVCKLNVDESQDIAARYGVMSIPTFIVFKGQDVKAKFVGTQDKKTLAAALDGAV